MSEEEVRPDASETIAWNSNHCSVSGSVEFTQASLRRGLSDKLPIPFQEEVRSWRVPFVDNPQTESAGNVVLLDGHVQVRSERLNPIPISAACSFIGSCVLVSVRFWGTVNDISGSSSTNS